MKYDIYEKTGFNFIKDKLNCSSPYGREAIKKIAPFSDLSELQNENNNLLLALNNLSDEKLLRLDRLFMSLKDVRRSIENKENTPLDEVSLFEIKRFLLQMQEIADTYNDMPFKFVGISISPCKKALEILTDCSGNGATFAIKDDYTAKLREIRTQKRDIEIKIRTAENDTVRDSLKHDRLIIADRESTEEAFIRKGLTKMLLPYKDEMQNNCRMIAKVDLLIAKARLAKEYGAVRPTFCENKIEFHEMTNPYIADTLKGREFVPLTMSIENGSCVITGANMGGKSVALKTLALNCLCGICGIFVFAKYACIPLLTGVSIVAEDSEDTKAGLSTFGGEIMRLKDELKYADSCKLIIFDELAGGTNPQEGAKIVRATVKYMNTKKAFCVFSTHYDNVAQSAKKHYRIKGLKDFDFSKAGKAGIDAIAENMNYGLYEAAPDEPCPREATDICRYLLCGEEILDFIEE